LIGNIYWVGLSDQASFLMTTPDGNILLDTTSAETAPWVQENIEKLGFKMKDIKIIMTTHPHGPHVGGFVMFKELTGAVIVAPARDAYLLEDGGRSDPDAGRDEDVFPPVKPDRVVGDGETVSLGGFTLVSHFTPGHTKGCTTWTTVVEDGGKKYNVVFMCPPSIQANLVNNPKYPNREEDFAKAFQVLKSLPCDVFLTTRSTIFKREAKQMRLEAGEQPNPFIDPKGCRDVIVDYEQRFHALQAKELKQLAEKTQ
jgi:metallo-beta-lactamase class B